MKKPGKASSPRQVQKPTKATQQTVHPPNVHKDPSPKDHTSSPPKDVAKHEKDQTHPHKEGEDEDYLHESMHELVKDDLAKAKTPAKPVKAVEDNKEIPKTTAVHDKKHEDEYMQDFEEEEAKKHKKAEVKKQEPLHAEKSGKKSVNTSKVEPEPATKKSVNNSRVEEPSAKKSANKSRVEDKSVKNSRIEEPAPHKDVSIHHEESKPEVKKEPEAKIEPVPPPAKVEEILPPAPGNNEAMRNSSIASPPKPAEPAPAPAPPAEVKKEEPPKGKNDICNHAF